MKIDLLVSHATLLLGSRPQEEDLKIPRRIGYCETSQKKQERLNHFLERRGKGFRLNC